MHGGNLQSVQRFGRKCSEKRNEPIPVLFTSAGRRVELIECFRSAARELGRSLRIIAVDATPELSPACHLADKVYRTPLCKSQEFIDVLVGICRTEQVALLVPTIDPELQPISLGRNRFEEIGTAAAVSSLEVIQIARNKLMTSRFLREHGIDTPRTETLEEAHRSPESWQFPVIIKPRDGSSSHGVLTLRSCDSLLACNGSNCVVQKYLEGKEYTVNLFFDREGLRCAIPHHRIETRGGEVTKGITERLPVLMAFSQRLGKALEGKAFGALCFQAIVANDGFSGVIDLNARFGGGYPLAHRAGANFARWLLEDVLNETSTVGDTWREGIGMLRYDASIFTDRAE